MEKKKTAWFLEGEEINPPWHFLFFPNKIQAKVDNLSLWIQTLLFAVIGQTGGLQGKV
jgi:hypothetical protein